MSTPQNRIPPFIPFPVDALRVNQTPNQPDVGFLDFIKQFLFPSGQREMPTDTRMQELISGRDVLQPTYTPTAEDLIGALSKTAFGQGRELLQETVRDPMSAITPPLSIGNLQKPIKVSQEVAEDIPDWAYTYGKFNKAGLDYTQLGSTTGGRWELTTPYRGKYESLNRGNELESVVRNNRIRISIQDDGKILLQRYGTGRSTTPTWAAHLTSDQVYDVLRYVNTTGRMPLKYGSEIRFPKKKEK